MKDFMQYKSYYGSVHFDAEELIFHGKIEFIRAHASYEATTARSLRKAFEEAVDDYINLCHQQDVKPEKPFKGSLNVRLGPDLHKRIAIAAAHKHISINKYIADTLDKATD